ncbi:MAG TPA: ATP-binding protein, partial [Prolixibacteraceae bacterium]|nr:ATP-binding protein [Prolixibacteraceae bacterium]
ELKEKNRQIEENDKSIALLILANKELAIKNEEKEKRTAELIVAKEIAEVSDSLKTAFLQNISHKIRTPLNGIIGFSELLNQEDLNAEEIKEFTGLIAQSGKRLVEIVNNVLDISKIQNGQYKIEQKPVLINSVFSDLLNFFLPVTNAKNIILHFHSQDDENTMIFSDQAKLTQILTNLISNAVKFTKSGNIDCGFEIKDDFVQLYVKDTGIGIPHDLYDRIFNQFVQSEQSLTNNIDGAGLGLSIAKGLVELLGGKIWVESEVDKGSTFYFTLPNITLATASQIDPEFSEIAVKRPNRLILIAEDDWISFQYLRTILEKSDITVIHAENGEQAVEFVRNKPDIDLILMDIKMPIMNGIDATKIIKRIRPDLPIIAQTAYTYSEEQNKMTSLGCDEYLAKPLDYAKLKELLKIYLN